MLEFELKILDYIKDVFGSPILDKVMPVITVLGYKGAFWIALTLVLLIFRKTRPLAFSMAIALLLGLVFGNIILKNLIARARPYEYNRGITLLIQKLKDYSFPSGHALAAFESATCIFIRYKKWGVAVFLLATAIAFSRMYLYVHFLSDVLAGIVLGIIFAIIASAVVNRFYKNKNTLAKKSLID